MLRRPGRPCATELPTSGRPCARSMRRERVTVVVGLHRLAVETHLPAGNGVVGTLHEDGAVLPRPVLIPPLAMGISLVHVDIVHAVSDPVVLPEYEDPLR